MHFPSLITNHSHKPKIYHSTNNTTIIPSFLNHYLTHYGPMLLSSLIPTYLITLSTTYLATIYAKSRFNNGSSKNVVRFNL